MPDFKVFNEDGTTTRVSDQTPLNDLTKAPKYMDALPDAEERESFVLMTIPAADGYTPRVVLVNPTLLATTQEVIDKIAQAVNEVREPLVAEGRERDALQQEQIDRIDTLVSEISTLQSPMQQMLQVQAESIPVLQAHDEVIDINTVRLSDIVTQLQTTVTALQAKVAQTKIGDATITFSATIAVGAGSRAITVNLAGVKKGDKLSLYPATSLPAGYSLSAGVVADPNKFTVTVTHPALVLGGSFSIPVEVWALR